MRLALRRLRRLVCASGEAASADGALLERFALRRDEAAFEALLQRHAPLVLGVCRRVLRDEQDAEDAFQATFLVLVKKAGSLDRQGSLAPWLYTVAYHAALRAREQAARRRREERQVLRMPAAPPDDDLLWRDLRPVLDEELARLGEKYRAPVVLCYLQGKTHDEAARELGWPLGTVAGRLARARALLRRRLVRRGLALSAVALSAGLAAKASAAVPAGLAGGTLQAAVLLAAGRHVAGAFPAHVLALGDAVLRTLGAGKVKLLLAGVLSLALLGGLGRVANRAFRTPSPEPCPGVTATGRMRAFHFVLPADPAAPAELPLYRDDSGRPTYKAPRPQLSGRGEIAWTEDARDWLLQAVRRLRGQGRPPFHGLFPLVVNGKVLHLGRGSAHAHSRSATRLTAHLWEERIPAGVAQSRPGSVHGSGGGLMARPLLSDALWERIEPLLPAPRPRRARFPGRKPLEPRRVLTGILFVLKTGIPWEDLPQEMGCGCGMTCLNYLKTWRRDGTWARLQEALLAYLPGAGRLDWARVTADAPAARGAGQSAQAANPPADNGRWEEPALYTVGAPARAGWMVTPRALS
jgi:RNA polymerase sigma factor (sigma-70 family)